MRISGGGARGIPLLVPKGDAVRPATDALRQAVFSSLAARVADARFLDLFAGSGAYGLEALSRGARGGVFVESNHRAIDCLRRNLAAVCKSLGRDESGLTVFEMDALKTPLAAGDAPDLVFVDPPYELIAAAAPPLFSSDISRTFSPEGTSAANNRGTAIKHARTFMRYMVPSEPGSTQNRGIRRA